MAFLDYTTVTTSDDAVIHEYCGTPRLGMNGAANLDPYVLTVALLETGQNAGALQMQFVTDDEKGLIYITSAGQRGWVTGSIRSAVFCARPDEGFSFGAYCLATQLDLVHGVGEGYALGFYAAPSIGDPLYQVYIARLTDGLQLDIPDGTILAPTATHIGDTAWEPQVRFTFEFTWISKAGQVTLEFWQGTDFTDMVKVLTWVHNDPPADPPVAEGLWGVCGDSGNRLNVYFEQTRWRKGVA